MGIFLQKILVKVMNQVAKPSVFHLVQQRFSLCIRFWGDLANATPAKPMYNPTEGNEFFKLVFEHPKGQWPSGIAPS
jgi:hypothetical protein